MNAGKREPGRTTEAGGERRGAEGGPGNERRQARAGETAQGQEQGYRTRKQNTHRQTSRNSERRSRTDTDGAGRLGKEAV